MVNVRFKVSHLCRLAFVSIIVLCSFTITAEVVIVKPGSELIDGNRLKPFSAVWTQYAKSSGKREKNGQYNEQLVLDKATDNWVHTQKVTNAGGVIVSNITRFDKKSLTPVSIHQTFENAPPQAPAAKTFTFNDTGYTIATTLKDGKVVSREVVTPTKMFNVANLGLVFAAMTLEEGKTYRMPSAFPQYQDGQYWMDVTASEHQQLVTQKGVNIPVWQLDVYWLNIKDGDAYAAGPNGSGGAYLISTQPEQSGAPVPAYVNDAMAILQEGLTFTF